MKTSFGTRLAAISLSGALAIGCGVNITVDKKPRDVDLSALENIEALNLTDSENFLNHLDNLKVIAVDLLMKQLTKKDYRGIVRQSIRDYRAHLIANAKKDYSYEDAFYASADDCRETGLSFDLDKAHDTMGIILKTAVLAKISEHGAGNINPALGKELAAIGQLILAELGLEIEGEIDSHKDENGSKTEGTFTLKLRAIDGEDISEEMKAKDEAESIKMTFERTLGEHYIGEFSADIEVTEYVADADNVTYAGKMTVEREDEEGQFVHTIRFDLGVKGEDPSYSRELKFEQVEDNKAQLKVTDTNRPGSDNEESIITLVDVEAGTQCKWEINTTNELDAGDEGGFADADGSDDGADATDDATDDSSDDADGGDDSADTDGGDDSADTDGGDSSDDGSDDSTDYDDSGDYDDAGDKGGDDSADTDGGDDSDKGGDDKGSDNDDDKGGDTGGDDTPGQNPGQTPYQNKIDG